MTVVIDKLRHPEKAHRPDSEIQRKPDWIRVKAPVSKEYAATRDVVRANKLHTVCEEAACPNIGECWTKRHATMMIMGDTCTRACAFCNVKTGLPAPLDTDEPANVANGVKALGLMHVVITSVDRDDLADGGAQHFADVITSTRALSPKTSIEVLTPDFLRKHGAIEVLMEAKPDVFNHNMETVPRLYLKVRPGARYYASLRLLERAGEWARYELEPVTGHRHQLRVHMNALGLPILHDGIYPKLTPEGHTDYARPLQLLARSIRYTDPLTGRPCSFESQRRLDLSRAGLSVRAPDRSPP